MSTLTAEPAALSFQDETVGDASPRPAQLNARLAFQDCTVIEPLRPYLRTSLKDEDTYLRFLPPLKGCTNPYWMLAAEYYRFRHTAFVHPSVFEPGAECLVERALNWFREHAPDQLPQQGLTVQENDRRFQLRPKAVAFAWALQLVHGKRPELILLRQSNHSGNGKEGLMAQVWAAANQQLQTPDGQTAGYLHGNITHSQTGGYVHIKKFKTGPQWHNVEYAATINSVKAGGKPYPLMPLLEQLPPAARQAIVPLQADRILHRPTEEEQHAALKGYLGRFYFEIFPERAPRRPSAPGTAFTPDGHDLPAPALPTAETAAQNDGAFDDRDADGNLADPLNGQTEGSLDPDGFDGAGFEGPGFAPVAAPPSAPAAAPNPAPTGAAASATPAAKRKTGSANGKTAAAAPGAAPATGGEEYPPFNQNVPLEIMRELYNPQTQQAGLKRYAHYKKQGAFNEAQTMAIESILKDAGLSSPA